jgi:cobalt-zinc-cadmium efflux system outer membrane protein
MARPPWLGADSVPKVSCKINRDHPLVEAKQAARLDVIQLEVEAERVRAEAEGAEKELPGAFRKLAAVVGAKDLPEGTIAGSLDDGLPVYELDRVRFYVLAVHPDVRSAQVGLDRARLQWQRAQAEVVPNVTVSAGYVRQNQNKSNDATVGVSLPVPVWNRNQGNIRAALAEVGSAAKEVERVENDLTERVAAAHRDYAAARRRAERLAEVRRKAQEAFRLVADEKNFTVTAVQRLVAQQAVTQANIEYVRALTEAWRAASVLSGLTLEDEWPAGLTSPARRESPTPKSKNLKSDE